MRAESSAGFSLIELIAAMLVLALLLALAAPRLDRGGVDELGFTQQVLTDLRIAQRRAQADRCEVRVMIAASGLQIHQRAALCSGSYTRTVARTDGASTLGGSPPPGMSLSATPGIFYFDSGGAAVGSVGGTPVDVSITSGAREVTVIGTTGYVSL